ncbi:hypothetical protein D3C75_951070 [compost metagenome]
MLLIKRIIERRELAFFRIGLRILFQKEFDEFLHRIIEGLLVEGNADARVDEIIIFSRFGTFHHGKPEKPDIVLHFCAYFIIYEVHGFP